MGIFQSNLCKLVFLSGALIGLPLLGAALAGRPLAAYLAFPPLTRQVQHSEFSGVAFVLFSVLALAELALLAVLLRRATKAPGPAPGQPRFPWWGWLAALSLAVFWLLAWTRFTWFEPLQAFTFTPLWLSFIVLVNALTWRLTGRCLLSHQPRLLLWLFPISAVFWWYFEYLNRYVQNWYYLGIESFSPVVYVIHASCAFSTVLPAVASVTEALAALKCFGRAPYQPRLAVSRSRAPALAIIAAGALGLGAIAVWPEYLFALVWLSPVLLFVALQMLAGEANFFSGMLQGQRWHLLALPALAALLCGFLWELWNFYSAAKWRYSIPLVHGYKLFEMPILGYAGYPVFGVECVVVTEWLRRILNPANQRTNPADPEPGA